MWSTDILMKRWRARLTGHCQRYQPQSGGHFRLANRSFGRCYIACVYQCFDGLANLGFFHWLCLYLHQRPIAKGRLSPNQAVIFALLTSLLGVVILLVFTNVFDGLANLASSIGYAFIYTMYLKRATPQNIVIGGLAGAAPPLLGWVAVTGEIHYNAVISADYLCLDTARIFGRLHFTAKRNMPRRISLCYQLPMAILTPKLILCCIP